MSEIKDYSLEPAQEQRIWQIVNVYCEKRNYGGKGVLDGSLDDYLLKNGITDAVELEHAKLIYGKIETQKMIRSLVNFFYRVMEPEENYTIKGWTLKDYILNLKLRTPLTEDEFKYAENYFSMKTGQHKFDPDYNC